MADDEGKPKFSDGRVKFCSSSYIWDRMDASEVSLDDAKQFMTGESKNLKIIQIEIHGYHYIKPLLDVKERPCHHLAMIKTINETWWSLDFSFGESVLQITRHPDYPRSKVWEGTLMVRSWCIKSEGSNSTVDQLFEFLHQKVGPGTQFKSDENFAKEIFNKLAITTTGSMLEGLLYSSSKQSGGSGWSATIRFIDSDGREDFQNDRLVELRNKVDHRRTFTITRIKVYKLPLNEDFMTNMVLFHSYLVFECRDTEGETWWWSLEKNCERIVLQKGSSESSVRDCLEGKNRCVTPIGNHS